MANDRTIDNFPDPTPNAGNLRVNTNNAANMPTLHEPTSVQIFQVSIGQRFGEYELLTEIARGGMGVVYRARQITLDRVVALKMILSGRLANPDDVARFKTEAEAAARLKHPNIVPVHDIDTVEGQHYFTMDYIEGISLDHKIGQGPLPSKVAARYVRILARAVHYAHRNGILHRDLKPSNVLIDLDDEPHITDFGLAKRMGDQSSGQTRTGAVLGTPSYMAPEQAQGKTNELGPAVDIYSLGAILYELITGRPPFREDTPLDTVMRVINHLPEPPHLINADVDKALETICLQCLEKDPAMRYASAEELGDDLQRYLDGESIQARSFKVFDRIAHVLDHDTHTADFATWSSMVFVMAIAIGLEHFAVFALVMLGQPNYLVVAARGLLFVFLGGLFYYNRGTKLLPTSAAERELWTIWIGYIASYFIVVMITRLLIHFDVLQPNADWEAREYLKELLPYPFISMMSGLSFFIMGANYWGRCYLFGVTFFVAAALMPFKMTYAPLIFGILWLLSLWNLALHLRRQAQVSQASSTNSSPSQAPTVQYKGPK